MCKVVCVFSLYKHNVHLCFKLDAFCVNMSVCMFVYEYFYVCLWLCLCVLMCVCNY